MTFGSAQSVKRTHAYDRPPNGFRTVWLFYLFTFYLLSSYVQNFRSAFNARSCKMLKILMDVFIFLKLEPQFCHLR